MKLLIVVDHPSRWPLDVPGAEVVASRDYLTQPKYAMMKRTTVFNMCRSYRYQSAGYYVSLLASARGHKPLPSVATMQDLRMSPILRIAGQEIDDQIQHSLSRIKSNEFQLSIYFGRNIASRYDRLALALFNQFPAPFLRATFHREESWILSSLRVIGAAEIPDEHHPFVIEQAKESLVRSRRSSRDRRNWRYDLAVLCNEHEELPPSDDRALRRFEKAADELGLRTTFIGRDDSAHIAEYDAMFIRTTTQVNDYTYSFSRRAAAEGLFVIDDPVSILRCTNKVYLAELMDRHRIATPRTVIFSKNTTSLVAERIGFPCVLKQPDSSFSAGVVKVDSAGELDNRLDDLFANSDLLLAQEFVPTEFDWRIGVLGGEPLYACRYHMARSHWQIIKREGKHITEGGFDSFSIADAPDRVISMAVRASKLIGDGLYGVDIKVIGGRPKLIEVNDNPSIESGVEDQILGDDLYRSIMRHFLNKLEERHQ